MEKKLSIIIPTLQNNLKVLEHLVQNLDKDSAVGEIIIIDNSLKGLNLQSEKVRVIIPQENLMVNPSWNLGMENAKFDYFGILNDDIMVPEDFCGTMLSFITPDCGILGVDTKFIINNRHNADKIESLKFPKRKLRLKKVKKRNLWFGIAMFGHKSSYRHIPDDIKVWYGDDYLFYTNTNNCEVSGLTVYHLHKLSSSNKKYDKIKANDGRLFNIFKVQNNLLNNYSFAERIFSLKNIYGTNGKKLHKTLCICGLKFVLK